MPLSAERRKKWAVYVELEVSGFRESPDYISALLGVHPSRTYLRGDSILRTRLKRKTNGWSIVAPCRHTVQFTRQVDVLMAQVAPFAHKFAALPRGAKVLLRCGIYDYNRDVSLYLSRQALATLAATGADVSIAYYDVTDGDAATS